LTKDLDDEYRRPQGSRDYKKINLTLERIRLLGGKYVAVDNILFDCCGDCFPWLFPNGNCTQTGYFGITVDRRSGVKMCCNLTSLVSTFG